MKDNLIEQAGNLAGYSSPENIGSEHWFRTLISNVRDIGLFMETEKPISEELQREWGKHLHAIGKDMIEWQLKNSNHWHESPSASPKEITDEEMVKLLIEFALAYSKTKQKDIANDAIEFLENKAALKQSKI